jgi:hypothetical protein
VEEEEWEQQEQEQQEEQQQQQQQQQQEQHPQQKVSASPRERCISSRRSGSIKIVHCIEIVYSSLLK